MEKWLIGWVMGLVAATLVSKFSLEWVPNSECSEINNVYTCEKVWVPVYE